jgi:hypothetical protein
MNPMSAKPVIERTHPMTSVDSNGTPIVGRLHESNSHFIMRGDDMEHTACTCHAAEHIPSQEELEQDKESFERSDVAVETRIDIVLCPLHAAAPELLEALEQMVRHGEHDGSCTDESGDPRGPDTYKGEGCLLHWQTSQHREDLAHAAIKAAKGDA